MEAMITRTLNEMGLFRVHIRFIMDRHVELHNTGVETFAVNNVFLAGSVPNAENFKEWYLQSARREGAAPDAFHYFSIYQNEPGTLYSLHITS